MTPLRSLRGNGRGPIGMLRAWAEMDPRELADLLWGLPIDTLRFARALDGIDRPEPKLLEAVATTSRERATLAIDLLNALLLEQTHRAVVALEAAGLDRVKVMERLNRLLRQRPVLLAAPEPISQERLDLLRYGRDLLAEAREGAFDHLVDRAEIDQMQEVLLRWQKANPILLGDAGVGKTALVERFASRLNRGEVHEGLSGFALFEIRVGPLVAGTRHRGDFEERIERLLRAAKALEPVILFVDEIHLLLNAGSAEGVTTTGAQLLKPALARSGLRLIGATTEGEYRSTIARDQALDRRFVPVRLTSAAPSTVRAMVTGQAKAIAAHHGVTISEELVGDAVELSTQHLSRRQPDAAVELVDQAASKARNAGESEVATCHLVGALEERLGRTINILLDVGDTVAALRRRVVGQDEAIRRVARRLSSRSRWDGEDRPLASFLFAGSTGVGKTELALALGQHLFGENGVLHLDMAEYAEVGSSALVGAPLGYRDSDDPGPLAGFLQRRSGLLLFDEIEKAAPQMRRLLLGILDRGRARTGRGELLDARGCVIVLTTNALRPDELRRGKLGFGGDASPPDPRDQLSGCFEPELLGRIDDVLVFKDLEREALEEILRRNLAVMLSAGATVPGDAEDLIERLSRELDGHPSGAREARRLLERSLDRSDAGLGDGP